MAITESDLGNQLVIKPKTDEISTDPYTLSFTFIRKDKIDGFIPE
jgi:hypothetical protein